MKFRIDQEVVFIHEVGGGVVRRITQSGRYIVEDSDGFEREFLQSELGVVHSQEYNIDVSRKSGLNEDESFSTARHVVNKERLTGSRKPIEVWELDLHIEELTSSHDGWSNADILKKQLRELATFYKKARAHRIRKVVIIHGVGMGVLRDEVRIFLDGKSNVEVYDADFRTYGKGATTVELFHH
ncbi:Smr/MutS family protein [Crocinitomicaceae bacterium]|nr:Smr/MutS family protein [Crocinitomicaceae bacterium]